MKKLTFLLSVVFLATIVFIGCEKDFNDVDKPDVPNVQKHTYFKNSGMGTINRFGYSLANNLKSTDTDDDSIGFIRFTSYYSEDWGQRNIHEIELYEDTVNLLLNNTDLIFESNRCPQWNYNQPKNVVDGVLTEVEDTGHYNFTDRGRWASNRWIRNAPDSMEYYNKLVAFSDSLTYLLKDNFIPLDSIINNTVYFDTVYFTINLPRLVRMDSLKLYLGEYIQVFDLEVSADTTKGWTLLKPEKYKVIK